LESCMSSRSASQALSSFRPTLSRGMKLESIRKTSPLGHRNGSLLIPADAHKCSGNAMILPRRTFLRLASGAGAFRAVSRIGWAQAMIDLMHWQEELLALNPWARELWADAGSSSSATNGTSITPTRAETMPPVVGWRSFRPHGIRRRAKD
jgi:hypothetical protein